jgi:hypothetical protein
MTMANSPTMYKGSDAILRFRSGSSTENNSWKTHSNLAISDFGITISRDNLEQPLVGEKGNYQVPGLLNMEGNLTSCRMYATALGLFLDGLINGSTIQISGSTGPNSLHWYIKSAQITNFDFTFGTAGDIIEGSVDWTPIYGYKISTGSVGNGEWITDCYTWPV